MALRCTPSVQHLFHRILDIVHPSAPSRRSHGASCSWPYIQPAISNWRGTTGCSRTPETFANGDSSTCRYPRQKPTALRNTYISAGVGFWATACTSAAFQVHVHTLPYRTVCIRERWMPVNFGTKGFCHALSASTAHTRQRGVFGEMIASEPVFQRERKHSTPLLALLSPWVHVKSLPVGGARCRGACG